jgi:hypothetical protein
MPYPTQVLLRIFSLLHLRRLQGPNNSATVSLPYPTESAENPGDRSSPQNTCPRTTRYILRLTWVTVTAVLIYTPTISVISTAHWLLVDPLRALDHSNGWLHYSAHQPKRKGADLVCVACYGKKVKCNWLRSLG